MSLTINLFDKLTNEKRPYQFEEKWTIGELRNSIAEEEGYDNVKAIKIFQQDYPFELDDDELVKDIVDEDQENIIQFDTFATFTSNKDILVWRPAFIGYSWFPLKKGQEETLNLGEKRHFMNKGMGKFAIAYRHKRPEEDGGEVYFAKVYRLSNSWTVKITAEEGEEIWNGKVMRVKQDGTEEEVKPYDVQEFKKNNRSNWKKFIEKLKETTEVVKGVLEVGKAGKDLLEGKEEGTAEEENNE